MACSQVLCGLSLDCTTSKGGIKGVWIANDCPIPNVSTTSKTIYTVSTVKNTTSNDYRTVDLISMNKDDVLTFASTTNIFLLEIYDENDNILYQHEGSTTGNVTYSATTEIKVYLVLDMKTGYEGNKVNYSITRNNSEIIETFTDDVDWYKYEFKKNTGSMTSTYNIDAPNGIHFVTTELVLQFPKMDIAKRFELVELCKGGVYVVVQDSNGKYWYLGYDSLVEVTAGTGQTGTNKTDGNYYQITFTDESLKLPYEVNEDAISF